MLFLKTVDNVIGDKTDLFFKTAKIQFPHFLKSFFKKAVAFISNELVPQIIFIFKIEIERSLCQTGFFHDIRNGGLRKPFFLQTDRMRSLTERFVLKVYCHRLSP